MYGKTLLGQYNILIIFPEYLDRGPACWDESRVRHNAGLVNKFDVPLSDVCLFIDAAVVQVCSTSSL